MMRHLETALYTGALIALSVALVLEGRTNSRLLAQTAVTPKALYALLSNPNLKVQIVDARAYDDDHYLDAHIPGAVPMPDCDVNAAPASARDRIYPYVMTVLVTDEGEPATFERCRAQFGLARNLSGGMSAWSDASLPEDTGDYTPPKSAAGGGCL